MIIRFSFSLMFVLLFCIALQAQDATWKYLGQEPPRDEPVVFARGIVSKETLEHSSPAISPDGKMIVWSSIKLPYNEHVKKLWCSEYKNGKWTEPYTLDLFNDDCAIGNDSPCFSVDGKLLYFSSEREKVKNPTNNPADWIINANSDLWMVEKMKSGWSKPKQLDSQLNTKTTQCNLSVDKNGNVFYVSYLEGALNNCGIMYSNFHGNKYQQPKAFGLPIEKAFQNWTPYIAPDGSYLIYSKCCDTGDYGDLYITFLNTDTQQWTAPVSMGAPINTWAQERFPYVSPDGKYLFFTRYTHDYNQDVFWVKADIINKLKTKVLKK